MQGDTTPQCEHYGVCGGCSGQHVSYRRQLNAKLDYVAQKFKQLGLPGLTIVPAPNPYHYRTRMDFVAVNDPIRPPTKRLGLRRQGKFNIVVDLQMCKLVSAELFDSVRKVHDECSLDNYDLHTHVGWLRYLVVRSVGNQKMLNIVTKSLTNHEEAEKLANIALQAGFDSVYWIVSPEVTDTSLGQEVRSWGQPTIVYTLSKKLIQIGPQTFCQNNISVFQLIVDYVADFVSQLPASNRNVLYDLYAGAGAIGIALGDMYKSVYACEIDESNVALAKTNISANKATNIQIVVGDVANLQLSAPTPDLVVVDPPRPGLGARGATQLLSLGAEHIVYISCNPTTQAQDYETLKGSYTIVGARAFDMFPQTPHVENVLLLRRIDT